MTEPFDAVVIGAGPAGEVAVSRLAAEGMRVTLVERELVGGECAYWACIPSKTLLRAPEVRAEARRAAGSSEPALSWSEIAEYRDFMIRNLDDSTQVAGYRETGRMEVRRGEDTSSLVDVALLKKGEKVQVGDRVVRRTGSETADGGERSYVVLTAKGGVGSDVNALPGANVYLNGEWKGATGTNGQAEIPLRPGHGYSLLVYRHGYQQLSRRLGHKRARGCIHARWCVHLRGGLHRVAEAADCLEHRRRRARR